MKRTAMAFRIAIKATERLNPSDHLKKTLQSDPKELIMQRDKVLYEHYDKPKDIEKFEGSSDFDEVSYLVRYLVDESGSKKKKDSY